MDQPIPKVSHSDVERIVQRDFVSSEQCRVWAILEKYQSEYGDPSRVLLAVLKLADGDIAAVQRQIEIAKSDYRDVLAIAEYPRYFREIGFGEVSETFRRAVIDDDWNQYQAWLTR